MCLLHVEMVTEIHAIQTDSFIEELGPNNLFQLRGILVMEIF